jgi:coenzyme F420-reducing hydrogenase delta subunit
MGDCHYLDGNVKAEKMFGITKELVTMLGIGSERLRLEWISGAEGVRFAEVAKEFTEQIKSIGPSGLKKLA